MENGIEKNGLDQLNCKILHELCVDARLSDAEIGRRVGLSSPAVGERIMKMEDHGMIKGFHAEVDLDKMGLTVQAYITFKTSSVKHSQMIVVAEAIPEIVEWHTITGSNCMIFKVAAYSGKELETVIARLNEFGETSTSLILSGGSSSRVIAKIFQSGLKKGRVIRQQS